MIIDLSTLNGKNGFVINGIADSYSGQAVSGVGDVNGDGKDDLIIGAPIAIPNGDIFAGESFVVFGKSSFGASLNVTTLDGSNGFVINGVEQYDEFGYSVSGAGDVNGDGVDDFIVGAWKADPNGDNKAGESYVVFGKSSFNATLELANLDGSNGFVINGIDADDYSGVSVSGAGDVNGDDIDDLIIGAFGADPNGVGSAGESYVVFGKGSFNAILELSTLDGSNGFVINGIDPGDNSGRSVSGAGDVNGDGMGDLIIGAWVASPNGDNKAGESYVVFGRNSFNATLELANLDGSNGFTINGIGADDYSGYSVSGAGDVNGDGKDDLIIGAYGANPNGDIKAGESYVVFGKSSFNNAVLELANLDGSNGFVINGIDADDYSGSSVSGVGDVNGDGKHDLIIGAYDANPNGNMRAGESYVVFGRSSFNAALELANLDARDGFIINGIDAGDFSGASVSGAGDVNGDETDDLIIGAWGADTNGMNHAGESYVVFGTRDEDSGVAALSSIMTDVKEAVSQVYEQVRKPFGWLQAWYPSSYGDVVVSAQPLPATAQQLKEAVKSYVRAQSSMTGLAQAKFKKLEKQIKEALAHEPDNEVLLKRLHRELEKHERRYGHPESMADIYQRLYGKPYQQRTSQVGFFRPELPQVTGVVMPESPIQLALPTTAPIAQLGKS